MPRVIRRRARTVRQPFPITVEQEVADALRGVLHPELYAWKLGLYYTRARMGRPNAAAEDVRGGILWARDHEAEMWRKYPDGPESLDATMRWYPGYDDPAAMPSIPEDAA